MAWPPPTLPINRTNATPQIDTHAADHNALAQAINDTVAELGANPSGVYPTVGGRLDTIGYGGSLTPEAYAFSPEHAGIQQVEIVVTGTRLTVNVPGPGVRACLFIARIQWRKALGDTAADVVHNLYVINGSGSTVAGAGTRVTMHDGGYASTVVTRRVDLPPGAYTVESRAYTTAGFVNAQERATSALDMGAYG